MQADVAAVGDKRKFKNLGELATSSDQPKKEAAQVGFSLV